jgi:hypothetical protein
MPESRYAGEMTGYVYMTASQKSGTIFIDVTNSLGCCPNFLD